MNDGASAPGIETGEGPGPLPDAPGVEGLLRKALTALPWDGLRARYWEQGEFLTLEGFLPGPILECWQRELPGLLPHVHRSFIPRHKRGGSVDCGTLRRFAPSVMAVYRSPRLLRFLCALACARLMPCPERDLHACALYSYTEPGDHIGFHYDTSYYRDRRYTVLIGLQDDSTSRLVCRLHSRDPGHRVETVEVATAPGSFVFFNGDRVLHRVTPLGAGQVRHVITMQYVTDPEMGRLTRFVSDMKDAIAYFGFRRLLAGRRASSSPTDGGVP